MKSAPLGIMWILCEWGQVCSREQCSAHAHSPVMTRDSEGPDMLCILFRPAKRGGIRMKGRAKEPVRNDAGQTLPKKSVNEMSASERREQKEKRSGKTMP